MLGCRWVLPNSSLVIERATFFSLATAWMGEALRQNLPTESRVKWSRTLPSPALCSSPPPVNNVLALNRTRVLFVLVDGHFHQGTGGWTPQQAAGWTPRGVVGQQSSLSMAQQPWQHQMQQQRSVAGGWNVNPPPGSQVRSMMGQNVLGVTGSGQQQAVNYRDRTGMAPHGAGVTMAGGAAGTGGTFPGNSAAGMAMPGGLGSGGAASGTGMGGGMR